MAGQQGEGIEGIYSFALPALSGQLADDAVRDFQNFLSDFGLSLAGYAPDTYEETEEGLNIYVGAPIYKLGSSDSTSRKDASHSPWLTKNEALSDCLVKMLAAYFPDFDIFGKQYSVTASARFQAGMPFYVSSSYSAITLGILDIKYDSSKIDLQSPSWDNIGTIVEELQHGVQFLEMWAKMEMVTERKGGHTVGREPTERTTTKRPPNYDEAQFEWKLNYLRELAKSWGYDNEIERAAKKRRDEIMNDLAGKYDRSKKPCP